MTPTRYDVNRWRSDPWAFRAELRLADGRTLADAAEGWQREHLFAPLDERDTAGAWRHKLAFLQLARGDGKSTIAAGMALEVAATIPGAYVYVVAADVDQAGILLGYISAFTQRSDALRAIFKIGKREVTCRNGSRIRVLSSDAPSSWGLGGEGAAYVVICDELWTWKGEELWTSLYSATGKIPTWRVIALTNAGHDETSVCWRVKSLALDNPAWAYHYAPEGVQRDAGDWIERMRQTLPASDFRRLILNEWTPLTSDGVFRDEWWQFYDAAPASPEYVLQAWDTAFSVRTTADYSVCTTWAVGDVGYYLLDVFRERVEFPQLRRAFASLYERWQPNLVLIEQAASGQSLIQELQQGSRAPIVAVPVDRDKLVRAHQITPLCEARRVFLPRRAEWLTDYLVELARFPGGRHDDQVDATTMALARLGSRFGFEGRGSTFQELQDMFRSVPVGPSMFDPLGGPAEQDARDDERGSGGGWEDNIMNKQF